MIKRFFYAFSFLHLHVSFAEETLHLEPLLEAQERLRAIPFPLVVQEASGRKVLPVDPSEPVAQSLLGVLKKVAPDLVAYLNQPDGPARGKRRINEVSALAETFLRERMASVKGEWTAEIPVNSKGAHQRSGYPDLLLRHTPSGRVAYLDPKLYAADQERSSLRTFYYQPRRETNKIQEDAHHLLLGIRHDGVAGKWEFTGWKLVDLSEFTVQLKLEFQGANKDLYQSGTVLMEED